MAEHHSTDEHSSPSPKPRPRPRLQNGSNQAPPALPTKNVAHSEKDVESRLGICPQSSLPVTPPSPLPSPPDDQGLRTKDEFCNAVESHNYENVEESHLYVNAGAKNFASDGASFSSFAPSSSSSSANDPVAKTASDSTLNNETEELQMRSKSHEGPAGPIGYRASHFSNANRVSQFVSAVEKAAKTEKPAIIQKPGRLLVSSALADKITSSLNRQQTLRAANQGEDMRDVGIDVAANNSEMSLQPRKISSSSPENKLSSRTHNMLDIAEDLRGMFCIQLSLTKIVCVCVCVCNYFNVIVMLLHCENKLA